MGGRAFGPPLCGGIPPATPPSKTIAHQPYAVIPAVWLKQRACCQPSCVKKSLNGGKNDRLVKNHGLVVVDIWKRRVKACQMQNGCGQNPTVSRLILVSNNPNPPQRPQKVFSAALRGPPRTKKVFFAALRGPSRTKGVPPGPSRPFAALRGPSRPFADKRGSSRPFVEKRVFSAARQARRDIATPSSTIPFDNCPAFLYSSVKSDPVLSRSIAAMPVGPDSAALADVL